MIQSIKSHYHALSKTLLQSSFHKICNDQQSCHCITCIWHECLLPQSQGRGSFLILQDLMGWATGFFILCLGEGQQKTVSTETDFAGPSPPVLYDQSLRTNKAPSDTPKLSVRHSGNYQLGS